LKHLTILAALALSGCVTATATPQQISGNGDTATRDAVLGWAREPTSVSFRSFRAYDISNGERAVCVDVNARNGFGGFTGFVPMLVNHGPNRAPIIFEGGPAAYECNLLAQGRSARF